MVLGHSHRRASAASPHKGKNGIGLADDRDYNTEDETVVDEEQGNILGHIISQLRPGADLSRVTLPTFFLEPRSMLERITNFMAHPEILLTLPEIQDPVQRFVGVVKFYLSGWHIKPPGVKKPLNPILGEIFTGYWDYPDGTKGYYISEQTSHHPPKSSYFFAAPEHHIRIDGTLKPRSKFLGNSAASMMEGLAILRFMNHKERYFVTQPNMYARGILFGKMKYELGDHSFVRCPETGLSADLEFKTKGYFSGMYNAIGGYIKDTKTDKNLYELSGLWSGEMFIKDLATGKKELLFDATHARETPPFARPIDEQEDIESQRLWAKVNQAIKQRDQNVATDEKSFVENAQRQKAAKRIEDGVEWKPRLFREVQGGPGGSEEGEEDLDWIMKTNVEWSTPEAIVKQVLQIHPILPGQQAASRSSISTHTSTESGLAPQNVAPQEPVIEHRNSSSTEAAPSEVSPVVGASIVTGASAVAAEQPALLQHNQPPTVQEAEHPVKANPITEPNQHSLTKAISPPANGQLIDPYAATDVDQRPVLHNQSAGAGDVLYDDDEPKARASTDPQERMINSMRKLKVGEPKEQAAVLSDSKPPSAPLDPLATPKATPRRDEDVDREFRIRRMDSQTHEIDEFVDAQS